MGRPCFRLLHGMLSWPQLVKGEVAAFGHPTKQLSKTFCSKCGETMFGINRLGMLVIPNSLVSQSVGDVLPKDDFASLLEIGKSRRVHPYVAHY